ncbi:MULTISPECIES: TIGR03808 family TAT-translocated repetitive protein [unclassified Bosea (in: a-proteobacteria)]|uniref:TIGR03808 family TAT-translocated repetitive protein n=1 Tax=unclassified Bosea (in: a-proteobacteria) TaxID=2653178 RepID=UPI0013568F1C|nr:MULTISPECIES: TIGR03808 family TAT-translocated repetitive protein [unclassified Bosea (in: a-proteobacteria)]
MFDFARSQGRPLFFQPGVYDSGTVTVLPTNGGGNPLKVRAVLGSVVLRFNGVNNFLRIEGHNYAQFEGVVFDGQDRPLTDYVSGRPAFIAVANGSHAIRFDNCRILNSPGIGVYVASGSEAVIQSTTFERHSIGIWSENAQIKALNNTLSVMQNNGIAVWRDTITGDSSTITGNFINGIDTVAGGTGQNGNGISIFRAIGVSITDNKIFNTKYSAIRCNGGGLHNVSNNNIYNTREVAIFIEAPGPGIDLTGCIVSNNSLDTVGNGILVGNSGQFNDGVSRSVIIEGNRLSNIIDNPIPDPGYYPPSTVGNGIVVEQDCVVSGNLIDGATRVGIMAGINTGARDLVVTGNLVRSVAIGIGVSNEAITNAGRSVVVSGNIVRSASIGGIVPAVFTGTTMNRVGTAEYGNDLATAVGSVTFGHNRYL